MSEAWENKSEETVENNPEETVENNPEGTVENNPEETMENNPEGIMEDNPEETVENNPEGTMEHKSEETVVLGTETPVENRTEEISENNENSENNESDGSYHFNQSQQPAGTFYVNEPDRDSSQTTNAFENYDYQNQGQNQGQNQEQNQGQNQMYSSYNFNKPDEKKVETKKSADAGKKWGAVVGMALVFGVIAGGTMFGVNTAASLVAGTSEKVESSADSGAGSESESTQTTPQVGTTQTAPVSENSTVSTTSEDGNYTVAGVAEVAMPSVVAITNQSVQEVQNWFGGSTEQYESESSGSGIIVGQNDTELLIATNNHVVDGANTLTVAFANDEAIQAQIKGTDAENDLAVLAVKIEDISAEGLEAIKVVELGDSDALAVGEQVVAIGNALGYGQSVTSGYVSALDREVTVDDMTSNLIQTDAAINPGNSGGALLNMKGQLIGINSVKYASSVVEGMGYAIPISTAQPILDELMNKETRYKVDDENASYIGISCKNVSSDTAQMYNMPVGVYVAEVKEDCPAQAGGMKKGDIITKLGGTTISTYDTLVSELEYYAAGESVEVIVSRADNGEYKEVTLTVTLGNKADMPETSTTTENSTGETDNSGMTQIPGQDGTSPDGSTGESQIPDINDLLP